MDLTNLSGPPMPGKPLPFIKSPALGFCVLFGLFFFMLVILSLALQILMPDAETAGAAGIRTYLRIGNVCQDILVFILPALIAALAVTRLPATFLRLDIKPMPVTTILACVVLLTSIPAMNMIISLNEDIHLPESMSGIEEWLRSMESSANDMVAELQGEGGIANLIISILIIGVLTGIAEELFFRGALQNLMFSTKMKKHLAIWCVAIIFSTLHMQFFGFIPRILLGAYFGYLLWWSGSIWVPVIAHALNNTIVVVVNWISAAAVTGTEIEKAVSTDIDQDWLTIALSVVVTALGIIVLRRQSVKETLRLK